MTKMDTKVKLNIWFFKDGFGVMKTSEWQEKAFKDAYAAIEWCRRNYQKIGCINEYRTFGQPISHFDVMSAIDGVSN